jgi:predicted nucleic acid-binding protein
VLSATSNTSIPRIAATLDRTEPLHFTATTAREAIDSRVDRRNRQESIQPFAVLIAGITRAMVAELVATDLHLDRIDGLALRDSRD